MTSKTKMFEDDLKHEDDLKNEEDLKNDDITRPELTQP